MTVEAGVYPAFKKWGCSQMKYSPQSPPAPRADFNMPSSLGLSIGLRIYHTVFVQTQIALASTSILVYMQHHSILYVSQLYDSKTQTLWKAISIHD